MLSSFFFVLLSLAFTFGLAPFSAALPVGSFLPESMSLSETANYPVLVEVKDSSELSRPNAFHQPGHVQRRMLKAFKSTFGPKEIPQVGGYSIGDKIGEGGQAQVYEGHLSHAHPSALDAPKLVAIKFADDHVDNNHLLGLLPESEFLKTLNKGARDTLVPRAVPMHYGYHTFHDPTGKIKGTHALVMSLHGRSLFNYVTHPLDHDQLLNPLRVYELMKRLIMVVRFVHNNKIIHADIKPENIVFAHHLPSADVGSVILVDFGMSEKYNVIPSQEERLTFDGSPAYASPKVLSEGHAPMRLDDLYSVGCVGLFAATGSSPVPAEYTDFATIQKWKAETVGQTRWIQDLAFHGDLKQAFKEFFEKLEGIKEFDRDIYSPLLHIFTERIDNLKVHGSSIAH